jgi:hypothetical protein
MGPARYGCEPILYTIGKIYQLAHNATILCVSYSDFVLSFMGLFDMTLVTGY